MAKQVRYLRQIVSHLNNKYGEEKTKAIMVIRQVRSQNTGALEQVSTKVIVHYLQR